MQEEPLIVMKLDASSRSAGNTADESLRLARRVKINEIRSTLILYTD
jgi:hypothetical protein